MTRRVLLILSATALLACGSVAARTKTKKLDYRTIQSGNGISLQSSQPRAFIAWNEADYRNFWSTVVSATEPPAIDFRTERPVLLSAGARPTGGWNIQVKNANLDRDVVYVTAPIVPPAEDAIVSQAITHPYILIAVPTTKGRKIRWLDEGGRDVELMDVAGPAYQ